MTEIKGCTVTGTVNEEILQLAACFARVAMRKWLLDIVAECNVKEYDRTAGRYTNVTIYDFEGYHSQVTALDGPRYHMRALRRHYIKEDASHAMGIRIQGLNGEESFAIDFADMAAIGGMTEPELKTVYFYDENMLPLDAQVNLDGFEVTVTELTEKTETRDDGMLFYRQYFTVQVKNRLQPDKPYVFSGESSRRNRPYGTTAAHVDALRRLLIEKQWEM